MVFSATLRLCGRKGKEKNRWTPNTPGRRYAPTCTPVRSRRLRGDPPHGIIKIVTDLQARGELTLARDVAGQYMDRLDNGELRFNYLALSARLGFIDQVMDLLEEYQAEGHVFPEDFSDRFMEASRFLLEPRMDENER